MAGTTTKDHLSKDTFLPEGQNFLCISFLTDKEKKSTLTGLKIRGVFETYEEACEHAKKIQDFDPYFNVFVGEMGSWLPFDPDPDSKAVKDSEYANSELNKMMKSYKDNQEKAKLFHEQRKNEEMRKNVEHSMGMSEKNRQDLEKKLEEAEDEKEKELLSMNLDKISEQLKRMEERKNELSELEKGLAYKIETFNK